MDNEKQPAQQNLQGHNISISFHEHSRLLELVYEPSKVIDVVIFIIILVGILAISDNALLRGLLIFALILFEFVFGLEKKRFMSIFDLDEGKLVVKSQSVWFPKLNQDIQEIKIDDIERIGLRRYVRRYGDGFELFLTCKHQENLLSGIDLSFSDSHACAENIREFLGLKTPIKAEG